MPPSPKELLALTAAKFVSSVSSMDEVAAQQIYLPPDEPTSRLRERGSCRTCPGCPLSPKDSTVNLLIKPVGVRTLLDVESGQENRRKSTLFVLRCIRTLPVIKAAFETCPGNATKPAAWFDKLWLGKSACKAIQQLDEDCGRGWYYKGYSDPFNP